MNQLAQEIGSRKPTAEQLKEFADYPDTIDELEAKAMEAEVRSLANGEQSLVTLYKA